MYPDYNFHGLLIKLEHLEFKFFQIFEQFGSGDIFF